VSPVSARVAVIAGAHIGDGATRINTIRGADTAALEAGPAAARAVIAGAGRSLRSEGDLEVAARPRAARA
jgi:hypothetical protein